MIHMAIEYKGVESLDTKVFREFIELNENVTGTTLGLRGEVIINRDKQTVKIPISFENSFEKSPEGFTSFVNTNIDIFKKYYNLDNSIFDNHLLSKYRISHRYRVPYEGDIYDVLEYNGIGYLLTKGIGYKTLPNLIRIMESFMTNEGLTILPVYLIEFLKSNDIIIAQSVKSNVNLIEEYKQHKLEKEQEKRKVIEALTKIQDEKEEKPKMKPVVKSQEEYDN